MGLLIVLSALVFVWLYVKARRTPCEQCGAYGPAGYTHCAYCGRPKVRQARSA